MPVGLRKTFSSHFCVLPWHEAQCPHIENIENQNKASKNSSLYIMLAANHKIRRADILSRLPFE